MSKIHLNPFEVAYFDTHPSSDRLGFSGTWSVYPFFASGTIVVNSHPDGLLILDPSQLNISRLSSTQEAEEQSEGLALTSAYPNPFNPSTTFSVLVHEDTRVTVNVFDMLGRHVERLVDGPVAAGSHLITLDGSSLPSGTYIIHARGRVADGYPTRHPDQVAGVCGYSSLRTANPAARAIAKTTASTLKYWSMNRFTLGPNFQIRPVTSKNRAVLLTADANTNNGKLIANAPALTVNNLYGTGVNPAVKIITNPQDSNRWPSS